MCAVTCLLVWNSDGEKDIYVCICCRDNEQEDEIGGRKVRGTIDVDSRMLNVSQQVIHSTIKGESMQWMSNESLILEWCMDSCSFLSHQLHKRQDKTEKWLHLTFRKSYLDYQPWKDLTNKHRWANIKSFGLSGNSWLDSFVDCDRTSVLLGPKWGNQNKIKKGNHAAHYCVL